MGGRTLVRTMWYPWLKTFHIIFVASWFAGLFYLPRIFVNLAMCDPTSRAEYARLLLMARKLLRFTHILAVPALVLGLVLWGVWFHDTGLWGLVKIGVAALVVAYQVVCVFLLQQFVEGRCTRSHVWFRWFNEIPLLLMTMLVILVVFKPF